MRTDPGLISDLYKLFKPGLGASILVTIIPGLLLGPELPSWSVVAFTMAGTFLLAISSFAYNQIIEIKTDALMERTRDRPLPSGRWPLFAVYFMASSMLVLGLILLALNVNLLAAGVALASFVHYVFIYTAVLKRSTPWNTLIGGFSGAVGPLIGEAAVANTLTFEGFTLFLLLFLWQPPHFWCLGIKYRDQYATAGIRILPVTDGVQVTLRYMIGYWISILLLIVLMYVPVFPPLAIAGPSFFVPAFGLGLLVLYAMWKLRADFQAGRDARPLRVFFLTILHMLVWHLAMTADLYLRRWS